MVSKLESDPAKRSAFKFGLREVLSVFSESETLALPGPESVTLTLTLRVRVSVRVTRARQNGGLPDL